MPLKRTTDEELELSILYHDAIAACWNANCSADDEEVDDGYIRNRLYSALYNMTEFLLVRKDRKPPADLRARVYAVNREYGGSCIPAHCMRLLDRNSYIYRDELALIGQVMDSWFESFCKRYSFDVVPLSVHSAVC